MSLIIDGYNLMYAAGIIGHGIGPGGLERSRLALLNFVAESIEPAELPATTVVFDSRQAPPGLPRQLSHRGITVRFASDYEDADELIEELIQKESAPRRLTVVSSDHRLHRAAKRRKAQAFDSDQWYQQTLAARRDRSRAKRGQPAKPPTPLAKSEVEYWLAKFSDASPDERGNGSSADSPMTPMTPDDIFPPGYLDSIDDQELDKE